MLQTIRFCLNKKAAISIAAFLFMGADIYLRSLCKPMNSDLRATLLYLPYPPSAKMAPSNH